MGRWAAFGVWLKTEPMGVPEEQNQILHIFLSLSICPPAYPYAAYQQSVGTRC